MTSATMRGNTAQTYGSVAKTFHWLTALLILTEIPLGLIANDWAYDTSEALATKAALFSLHKTLGITIFFVALLRILWALSQPKPGPLHPERRLETWAAETVHWLLYGSLVIVPLSGWLHHAATSGFAPIWWPLGQGLPLVPQSEAVAHFFGVWHETFVYLLIAAVLLHIAGALKHQIIDRDSTLARMLPGRAVATAVSPATDHPRGPLLAAAAIYAVAIIVGSVSGLGGTTGTRDAAPQLQAQASGWTVETGSLGIEVRQLGSVVEGGFADWTAAIEFDPDAPAGNMGSVRVEIAVPSLTLGSVTQQALDTEFFDATAYPTAVFEAAIAATPEAELPYVAEGTLTLKGASVPVTLPFALEIDGDTAVMQGGTTLDRRNYEIGTASYNDEGTVGFGVDVVVDLTATRVE